MAADGKDLDEAIRQGKKARAEKKKAAKSAAEATPEKPTPAPKPAEMTDDEWLNAYCSKILSVLPYKSAFRRDAIMYKRAADKLIGFRKSMKKIVAETKKPGENGQFFSNIFRIVCASHPMNWLICDGCNGNGHVPNDKTKQCTRCLGGGYKLKYEET
jgi:hypothetical protein